MSKQRFPNLGELGQKKPTSPHLFYHVALGGKYVPCAVLFDFEPGVIGAGTSEKWIPKS